MGHPSGDLLLLEFIRDYRTDPSANDATMTLANYYYNEGDYDQANTYYASLNSLDLSQDMLSEARFKQGYGYFVRKDFSSAESVFGEVRELKTIYYYPVNYYYGMCKFFRQDYDGALASFERVAQSEKYRDYVPYYITQIYFVRGEYDRVISYAEPKLAGSGLHSADEMRLLLGRAYFETQNYSAALPHLTAYAAKSTTMRAEDFYQLAFSQYQSGDCTGASSNFKQIASQQNLIGQRANFYLADCYLKSGDKITARTAFRNVSKMNYDPRLRDEAMLQYGRLSAELHYDAEAISALRHAGAGRRPGRGGRPPGGGRPPPGAERPSSRRQRRPHHR
jgi:TolA-binding protein